MCEYIALAQNEKIFLVFPSECYFLLNFCIHILSPIQIQSPKIKIGIKHDNADTVGEFNYSIL